MKKIKITIGFIVLGMTLFIVTPFLQSCDEGIEEHNKEVITSDNHLVEVSSSQRYNSIDDLMKMITVTLEEQAEVEPWQLKLIMADAIRKMKFQSRIDVGVYSDGASKLCFNRYNIKYRTVDISGKPVILSGAVILPGSKGGETVHLDNISLYNEHFYARNAKCPSYGGSVGMTRALFNSLVVIPDLEGGGDSYPGRPLVQFASDALARQTIDCVLAALELLDQVNAQLKDGYVTYNMGASRGGQIALAVQKLLETREPSEVADKINLASTFCSSPTLDLANAFRYYIDYNVELMYPFFLVSVLNGIYYAYSSDFKNYEFTDFFSDAFNVQHATVGGKEYSMIDLVRSMEFSEEELIDLFLTAGFNSVEKILNKRFFSQDGTVNDNDDLFQILERVLVDNDPSLGWEPSTPVLLSHCCKDQVLPYNLAVASYENLEKTKYGHNENVRFKVGQGTDHISASLVGIVEMMLFKDPAAQSAAEMPDLSFLLELMTNSSSK